MGIVDVRQREMEEKNLYTGVKKRLYGMIEKRMAELYPDSGSLGVLSELRLILRYFAMPETCVPHRESEEDLGAVFDASGVPYRNIVLHSGWWKEAASPLFVRTEDDGTWHAALPGHFGRYFYYDKKKKRRMYIDRENAGMFENEAVCFYRPFPKHSMTSGDLFVFLAKCIPVFDYLFLFLAVLFVVLLGMILPCVNEYIFHFTVPSGQKADIPFVALLLFGAVVSTSLFGLFRSVWVERIGDKVRVTAQAGLWDRLFHLPPCFFKEYDAGELANRAMMLEDICDAVTGSVVPVLLSSLFSLVYLIQVGSFAKALVMPTLWILAVTVLFSIINSLLMLRLNQRKNRINAALSGFVYQLCRAVCTLKIHGAQVRAFERWSRMYEEKMKAEPNLFLRLSSAFSTVISLGGTLFLYHVVFYRQITVSEFLSFQVLFGLLAGTAAQLSGVVSQAAFIRPAMQMLKPLLGEVPESGQGSAQVKQLTGKIDMANICFKYQPDMDDVLHNLTISIEPGEYVALVGPSGCGKSTLFRLLLGFEKPECGVVSYDGRDLAELDKTSVRRRIGTVLQNGMLLEGDIFSNIALCAGNISMDKVWEAARESGCDRDIEDMPMGMYTMVSDGGGSLSGGQKQRILIARAFAMKPDIFLFDEATSALDNMTQLHVTETLSKKHMTRIVIAHRLSTIQNCDRIIYLDRGSVVEEGSYRELMEKKGRFYEMAKWQLV